MVSSGISIIFPEKFLLKKSSVDFLLILVMAKSIILKGALKWQISHHKFFLHLLEKQQLTTQCGNKIKYGTCSLKLSC